MRHGNFLLIIIFITAISFRTFGTNWDSGTHMHPDERAIILASIPLHFPTTISDFFSPQSPLNPHFFAYGSFPLYLLKVTSIIAGVFDQTLLGYSQINLLGRVLSALFDSATAGIIFLIGKKLFGKNIGIITAALYAISVLSIQLSHFFAVDTILTFFITVCLYRLLIYYQMPSIRNASLVGLFLGLGIATKNSALALTAPIVLTLFVDFLLIFIKQPHKPHIWFPHIPRIIRTLFTEGVVILITACITFSICEPYALIDFHSFWQQTLDQSQMTHNAFTFPYTLQFVGKIPYWYELKNIVLWGLGPAIGIYSCIGAIYFTLLAVKKEKHSKWAQELIVAAFFWSYFAVVGKFAIGFMRYMLPIYPLLTLFAALIIHRTSLRIYPVLKRFYLHTTYYILLATILLGWPLSFMHIYTRLNTRILATDWINNTIPIGKKLAVEHWDDALPIIGQEKYQMITFPLYDPDTPEKWQMMNENINQTDYIIIASNRLYIPLQKLTNCTILPPGHCYVQTANYYQNLFNGKLGFNKVKEFAVYPTIPFLNIPINDQSADESFTVFDHPKIMIFGRK